MDHLQLNIMFLNALEEEYFPQNENVPRIHFKRLDAFEMADRMFVKLRLPKLLMRELINLLDPYLAAPTRASALDKQTKVLIAVHFYATGSYQTDIGFNVFCGSSQPSVSRCVTEVSGALNNPVIFNHWVKFYETIEELNRERRLFFENYGIPGIVGIIDCGHVAIFPPAANDNNNPEEIYVNRKNYHSINVQFVCDSRMRFVNVNSRFPGGCNDLYIWSHSALENTLRNLSITHPGYYVIGDSGYLLRKWIQIPDPGTPEHQYNQAFKACRSMIERAIGLLKIRFRCLLKHRVLHYKPTKCSQITNACVILHNMCIVNNIPDPEVPEENLDFEIFDRIIDNNAGQGIDRNIELEEGRRLQNEIITNYFVQNDH